MQLVISDAHAGLKTAINSVLLGAAWQRCRVHLLRNDLSQVPKGSAEIVAATIRTVFAQPGLVQLREQMEVIAGMLGRRSRRSRRCSMRWPTTSPPSRPSPRAREEDLVH